MKKIFLYLIFLIASCKSEHPCSMSEIFTETTFNFSRNIDGTIVFHDELASIIFPSLNFSNGLMTKSGVGQKIRQTTISTNGSTSKVTYTIQIGTAKTVDFAGGCIYLLICNIEGSDNRVFFNIWASDKNTIDYMRWLPGGLGLSYYGQNIVDFRRALIATDANEEALTFLNKIYSSAYKSEN